MLPHAPPNGWLKPLFWRAQARRLLSAVLAAPCAAACPAALLSALAPLTWRRTLLVDAYCSRLIDFRNPSVESFCNYIRAYDLALVSVKIRLSRVLVTCACHA